MRGKKTMWAVYQEKALVQEVLLIRVTRDPTMNSFCSDLVGITVGVGV